MPNTFIHILANGAIILGFFLAQRFLKTSNYSLKELFLLTFSSLLIDIDHLLADPIYDPSRCSINFHPLHSWYAFPFYAAGLFWKKYSPFFVAVIVHLILDGLDCLF